MYPLFSFSIADLRRARAWNIDKRSADLATILGRAPTEDEQIPVSTWWALPSTTAVDAAWTLRLDAECGTEAATRVAVFAARLALPAWGRAHTHDARPRLAIEAAEAALAGGGAARYAAGASAAGAAAETAADTDASSCLDAARAASAAAYAGYGYAAGAGKKNIATIAAVDAIAYALRTGADPGAILTHLRGLYGLVTP